MAENRRNGNNMLWICDDCTTAYSPGAAACPHCGSTAYHDQGEPMAKVTRSAGPSNAAIDPPTGDDDTPAEDEPTSEVPASAAPKSEWAAYARALGAPDDVLEGTKAGIRDWVADNQ